VVDRVAGYMLRRGGVSVYEFVALAVGAALGIAWHRLGLAAGAPLVAAGALTTGVLVSWLSGELEVSWAFLVFDVGQVVVAAGCVAALATVVGRRRLGP
jgi:hypothetical protein